MAVLLLFKVKKKNNRGQVFSIDVIISIILFIVILILVFYSWEYSISRVDSNEKKKDLSEVCFYLTQNVLYNEINTSLSSFTSISNSVCDKNGVYSKTMNCFFILNLENKSIYYVGQKNITKKYTSTISRIILMENQMALLTVGVQNE